MQYKTSTTTETRSIGANIAKNLKGGDIVLLKGNLGAGKTTLTKGIAEYFGIKDVVSPTFTLMQVYHLSTLAPEHPSTLVHIDTYRLEDEDDLVDIGVEDYLGDENTVCLIEWPEKIKRLLAGKKTIEVKIEHVGEEEREIKIED